MIEESIAFNATVAALVTTGYVVSFWMQEEHPCCVLSRPDQNMTPMKEAPVYGNSRSVAEALQWAMRAKGMLP